MNQFSDLMRVPELNDSLVKLITKRSEIRVKHRNKANDCLNCEYPLSYTYFRG